jgi:hypothetical protein
MYSHLLNALLLLGALLLGGVIGFVFGSIQNAASVRHRKIQQGGQLHSGWALMPGSMRRTAFLLIALVVVQIACPLFFESATVQWLVSAGIVLGYGWTLLKKLRDRSAYGA